MNVLNAKGSLQCSPDVFERGEGIGENVYRVDRKMYVRVSIYELCMIVVFMTAFMYRFRKMRKFFPRRVTAEYTHPNGNRGKVSTDRTVVFDKELD